MGGGKIALRKQIDVFMKGNRVSNGPNDQNNPLAPLVGGVDDEPIADLYQDTSIMFSDIVGEYLHLHVDLLELLYSCITLLLCQIDLPLNSQ